MNIASINNDEQRFDLKLDCTSCSVMFPNYKLFYTFRKNKPGTKWVVLALDTDMIFLPNNIVYFCQTNAAAVFPQISEVYELCTTKSFENMFCNP